MNKEIDQLKSFENFLFAILLLSTGILAVIGGQDNNWDMLDYHYYNGYAFLHNRYFHDIAPAMVQTHLNPVFEIINYWLFSTQKAVVAVFLLGTISGISAFISYKIGMIMFENNQLKHRVLYSLCAMIIGLSGMANYSTLGLATNDNKMGLLVMISLYLMIRSLRTDSPSSQNKFVAASGIIIGMTTGFKMVAGLYAIGSGIALLFIKKLDKRHFALCIIFSLSTAAGFLISNGYWMYFLYHNFNSPTFPYYNDLIKSPYIKHLSMKDPNYYPQHYLTFPFYLALGKTWLPETSLRDPRLAFLYSLTIAFLAKNLLILYKNKFAFTKKSDQLLLSEASDDKSKCLWKFLIIWFFTCYIIWFLAFTIYRYIIPHEFIAGIFIIFLIQKFIPKFSLNSALIIILIITMIYVSKPMRWGTVGFKMKMEDLLRSSIIVKNLPTKIESNSVIFIDAPTAYLIPFFPESIKFVGIPYIFDSSDKHDLFYQITNKDSVFHKMAVSLLYDETIPRYIMLNKSRLPKFNEDYLIGYGAKVSGTCYEFDSNLSYQGIMQLCPITTN